MMRNRAVLNELKKALMEKFPGHIEKIILFGSRAKGNAGKYSDYDVLIVLKHSFNWKFKNEIQALCWEIDYKHDILTDVKIISIDELRTIRGKQPYILNALESGVSL
jgi:predicted nucleotidyltransferase